MTRAYLVCSSTYLLFFLLLSSALRFLSLPGPFLPYLVLYYAFALRWLAHYDEETGHPAFFLSSSVVFFTPFPFSSGSLCPVVSTLDYLA